MSLYPGARLPWVKPQFCDEDGNPLAGGFIYFYISGTSTPFDTFSDVNLTAGTENPNPMELDAGGFPQDPIYLQPSGYKVVCTNADDEQQWEEDEVEDVGQTFASTFGNVLSEGSNDVVSGYTVLVTDRLVTVDSTGGADPCVINLLPASSATQMLTIKNMGTEPLAITPDGADTIEGLAAVYTVPAAVSPNFPAIVIISDAVSSYTIIASHGL